MTEAAAPVVRTTKCPSCGAGVPLHTRAAVQAVCPYCRSTLVRTDLNWEDVGKMAALAEDLTPVRLGMRGEFRGTGFTVIGRLQKQHPDGVWNEWLLMLDNNQRAWLGEGSGLYYWTEPTALIEPLPPFSSLQAGKQVRVNNRPWLITDVEPAKCIACEGELPFRIPAGAEANAADAMAEDGTFATLDYGDYPPAFYTGRVVDLEELNLVGATQAAPAARESKGLRCGKCGSAMTRHVPGSLSITCASCSTVHNQTPRGKLLVAWQQALLKMRPLLEPGRRGRLEGVDFEVVGWQHRMADGDFWDEYLLYHPEKGLRWLVESQGHWTWMRSVSGARDNGLSATLRSNHYNHFATYTATTIGVLGEFNWRVKKDEKWQVRDFIAPPAILCREHGSREITWSLGEYLPREQVAAAFGLDDLPAAKGVAPNQPGIRIKPLFKAWLVAMLAAAVIGPFARGVALPQKERIGQVYLPAGETRSRLVSEPFTLHSRQGVLRVNALSTVDNHWMELDYTLVRQDNGDTREAGHEVGFYSGIDSEGSWSEGDVRGSVDFSAVPAGTYVMTVDASTEGWTLQGQAHGDLYADISVEHDVSTGNWWWLLGVLGLGPLVGWFAWLHWEQRRWANSDHPWSTD